MKITKLVRSGYRVEAQGANCLYAYEVATRWQAFCRAVKFMFGIYH